MTASSSLQTNIEFFDKALNVNVNFDIIKKNVVIGETNGVLYFLDGFVKDGVMAKVLEYLIGVEKIENVTSIQEFSDKYMPYIEVSFESENENIALQILSGPVCLFVDGFSEALVIDVREYPARSVEEPENDKVLRGAHEGFVETLVFNTAMIRRHIRDEHLVMQMFSVGRKTKSNVVMCYLSGTADDKTVSDIEKKIKNVDIAALTMAQESLVERLINTKWFNPFPKVRYSERPDVCAASIMEGKIAIIVDNTPAVMILPTTIFDFMQDANDYYFPPLTATYLRLSKIFIFLLTLILMPTWYLLMRNPDLIPSWLEFITINETNSVPLLLQILVLELAIDAMRIASLNTPSALSNSFSIIGALVLGEFAVKAEFLVPEVILFGSFVAMANYTQASFELGYAFKFMRIITIVATAIFNIWGYVGGLLLTVLLICFNKTVAGKSYIYPLVPFNFKALSKIFIRQRTSKNE